MTSKISPRSWFHGIRRLTELLLTHRWSTLGGLLGVVVADIVALTVPWITKLLVDRLQAHSISPTQLMRWGAALLTLGFISFAAKLLWRHWILGASRRIEASLRRQLLQRTLSLTMRRAKETETGKFMALASNDIPAVGQALAFGLIAGFDSLFITTVAACLMFQLSPQLTAWALIPFPVLGVLMLISMRLIYGRWDRVQDALETLTEKTRESLSGMRTLRAYVQQGGDSRDFEQRSRDYFEQTMSYVRVDATYSPIILLLAGSSSALLLYFGGRLVVLGQLSVGDLAAFIGYLGLLTWPMIAAGWMLILLQRGSASMARLDEILLSECEPANDGVHLGPGTLEIRHLSFSYSDSKPAIDDWSFHCAPGQMVGIVGPVGSGKSTFLRLLMALEEVPEDSIFWQDQDLTGLDKSSVRSLFSPVSQEPFLFSDTIANNLRLAHPAVGEHEIQQAIVMADMESDLALFPLGLETELGERGVSLSGGQRQRTALARAWLKPAPVLLLDDTLSAVDTLTERRILGHLKEQRMSENPRAVIVVSHRLSAVRDADLILVAQDGRLIDRGIHDELSQRPGLYRTLLHLQDLEDNELV